MCVCSPIIDIYLDSLKELSLESVGKENRCSKNKSKSGNREKGRERKSGGERKKNTKRIKEVMNEADKVKPLTGYSIMHTNIHICRDYPSVILQRFK